MDGLTLRKVTKSFRGRQLFEPVSGEFLPGDRVAILGPSGRGKTTLLRMIAGLETPDSGEILLPDGVLSMVFQENVLLEGFTAAENIASVADLSREEILELLDRLELREVADEPVRTFSGGMKRRLALLRALSVKPDLLLCDEVFRETEPSTRENMRELVKKEMKDGILLFVTHEQTDIIELEPTKTVYLETSEKGGVV